ncbi:MAG: zinc-ribbon domain-containing protein [Proteobacteria bacterium]|nr:zinc-ribbon domain-containing protein [Pseudomonadota bacterium]
MIITCNKCSTRFNLDDSLVKEGGSKCRCAVCNHILTAYPLSREPETVLPEPWQPEPEEQKTWQPEPEESEPEQPDPEEPEPWQSEPEEAEPKASEPWEIEQTPEEASDFDFESDLDDDDLFKGNSDLEMESLDLSSKDSDLEMEDLDLSSKDSDIEIDNPYLEFNENDLEIDDDFSFKENTFDMEEEILSQKSEVIENFEEFEDDDIKSKPIEDDPISFDEAESSVTPEKEITEDVESLEKETKTKIGLPEEKANEVDPPPKKERKVIVKPFVTAKPKPIVTAKPKPTKKKKKSFFRIPVIILLLVFLLAIGAYIASVMTGYKLPAIDQYIKKPIPEISEAKPIPNQKSVNGRFVTNSTAGTLFVITGRIENPSNISYSHIEIRGALITKNKEEAKIKNVFCGNIITEDMLKTGNISDINTLLTLKEGAHKINVNVAPGASVPFMVVFSDLPEKLENFTIKVAGFDKAINIP